MAVAVERIDTALARPSGPHDWCYASGLVAAFEPRLLRQEFFEHLLEVESVETLLPILSDTELEHEFVKPEDIEQVGDGTERFRQARFLELRAVCPRPTVVDLFFLATDVVNFKAVAKNRLLGLDEDFSPYGLVPAAAFEGAFEGRAGPLHLRTLWGLAARITAIAEEAEESAAIQIDLLVDAAHLRLLARMARSIRSDIVRRYFDLFCAAARAEALLRAPAVCVPAGLLADLFLQPDLGWAVALLDGPREALAERLRPLIGDDGVQALSGTAGPDAPAAVRRWRQRALMRIAREARAYSFGPETVFGYLCGLDAQLRNLRVIVGAIVHRMGIALVRPLLGDLYV